ncbi:MAG: DUF423 domain-containing protein [Pricia sp.]
MVLIAQVAGALYGLLAIIFGAFGAHALKKSFSEEQLKSFETGVKYQMYHAIVLVMLGFNFNLNTSLEKYMIYCFIIGTFLFSFSIYGLTLSARNSSDRVHEDAGTSAERGKWKFLGPITPIGGLLLFAGWALLLYQFIGRYF